ncbi:Uma2 family endonuclease [Streptomyces sp. NPDC003077]|uniref:Uma2 family endonuclease n=1 Tax=Streptomyces sp. NPDC003077 TaxID=3154443 RepID=UPI00339E4A0F
MTIAMIDRTEMADSEHDLDEMFELLERMSVPEGYRVEIVEGVILMSPQRETRWNIILKIILQIQAKHTDERVLSDYRIDYPGNLNGFASDVTLLKAGASRNAQDRWECTDVEFVAEVISKGTAANDYGPKKAAYAAAGVPVYLIVDPYVGRCRVYTLPKEGEYASDLAVTFGTPVDLTDTPLGMVLATDGFPRETRG